MSSLSYEVPNKTYDIRSSPNSLQAKSLIRLDLTTRRAESSLESRVDLLREEKLERVKSTKTNESSGRNVNESFSYDNYFEINNAKNFQLPPVAQAIKPETPKPEPKSVSKNDSDRVKQVKHRSAVQMVNDLTHLSNNINHQTNVHFYYGDDLKISVHSLILFVRSAWFRRSWRMAGDMENSLHNEYNFQYKSTFGCGEKIDISLISEVPQLPNGEFNFEIVLSQDQDLNEFHEAFKQFKQFLYLGDCEIHSGNSMFLTVLAEAFKIDSLKCFLSVYYQGSISSNNIDGLIQTIQLAHLFGIQDLKAACISMINRNAILVVNAASWKKLSNKYPELVLEIFTKN